MKQKIKLSLIDGNSGQIEGVKSNPRTIKDAKYKKLLRSLTDDPELLEHRGLLVFPFKGRFVAIGGNMRLKAMREIGHAEAWCEVIDGATSTDKLNAYTIKDNSGFGDWSMEMLSEDWSSEILESWGVDVAGAILKPEEYGTDFELASGAKSPFQQMTFTLGDEQAERIKKAIADIKTTEEYKYAETMGNENSNGNALYLIIMQWEEQKR